MDDTFQIRKSNANYGAGQFALMLLDTARQVNSPNKWRGHNEEGSPHTCSEPSSSSFIAGIL
jgi:hypothetical protein